MPFHDLPEDFQELLNAHFNPDSPMSFAKLLPPGLSESLLDILTQEPELIPLLNDEENLMELCGNKFRYRPTALEERIRMSFWLEYETALAEGRMMIVRNIHSLVCDTRYFYRVFKNKPWTVAFFLCRPQAYQEQVKEILHHGMKKLRQILEMSEYDHKGKLNMKLLELKVKVTAMVDCRIHGAPKQSIQQLNVNVDANKQVGRDPVKTLVQKGDMLSIQKRLSEIESESKKLQGQPVVQQAEVVEAELVPVEKG